MNLTNIPLDDIFFSHRLKLDGKKIERENGNTYLYARSKKEGVSYFKSVAELSPNCSNCGMTENFSGKTRREVQKKLTQSGWRKDNDYKNMTVHICCGYQK